MDKSDSFAIVSNSSVLSEDLDDKDS